MKTLANSTFTYTVMFNKEHIKDFTSLPKAIKFAKWLSKNLKEQGFDPRNAMDCYTINYAGMIIAAY